MSDPSRPLPYGAAASWPEAAHEAGEDASPGTLARLRVSVVMLMVTLYLVFNYGFMQLRFPPVVGGGVPLGEIVLIAMLVGINYTATLGRLAATVYLGPFLLWWLYAIGRAVIDARSHGIWALRDAVHAIESLFLLVGFAMVARPALLDQAIGWLPRIALAGALYGLSVMVRELVWEVSPLITTGAGLEIPLFGMYSNTAILLVLAATWLMLTRGHEVLPNLAAVFLLGFALFVFQQRTVYLTLIAVLTFLAFRRRSHIGTALFSLYVLLLFAAALPVLGISIHGRLGEAASLEFLGRHFLAIFGISDDPHGAISSAAAGVDLRLRWWWAIYDDLVAHPLNLLMGLGYGIPLTDMGTIAGPVREPHNSYISIIARTGLIGAVAWTWMHLLLLGAWRRALARCREIGWNRGADVLLVAMVYFIAVWVLSLGEDGFEKPYNTIPYYVFMGIVLRMAYMLDAGEIGPQEDEEEGEAPPARAGP
jgi:hypothetical protein